MIIVKIIGGLGNQMFQYALGRNLANYLGAELVLDISAYDRYATRKYCLNDYNIQEKILDRSVLKKYNSKLFRLFDLFHFSVYSRNIILDKSLKFDPKILKITDNKYLAGYWQSEKYFENIPEIIREEYKPKSAPDRLNRKYLNMIQKCHSVSLHVRRGDYVSDRSANSVHGVCGPSYYENALKIIEKKTKDFTLFIFSDDMPWVKKNLIFNHTVVYVEGNGPEKSYEDLRLMSCCEDNIIANSSFSWWGAWLNIKPNKIVIAPKQWFRDPKMDSSDMIPKKWKRI
ncbi:MAG: alpha-1,2-fucosyltransferase [Candidatus Berkelbacteria bacterium]